LKDKNKFFKDIVLRIADQSECISRKVGAIITIENRIIAEGWNSPPKKCLPDDCIRCNSSNHVSGAHLEMAICQHAEQGAIATASYLGISIKGGVMYCTTKPCAQCASLIVHSGINKVYFLENYNSNYTDLIFMRGGISCQKID
jgi:dCMP deaminase